MKRSVAVIAIALVLSGCTMSGNTIERSEAPSSVDDVVHSVPRTPDPAPNTPTWSGPIEVSEASLSQLSASVSSTLEDLESDPSTIKRLAQPMSDFSQEITVRCYPQLSVDEIARLDETMATYSAAMNSAAIDTAIVAARTYFDAATELCMYRDSHK